ncbi:MAG: tRNA (adenosine(37)-N6)-threonylcarbamoyltransferase complex ATPase subunit type 1 TsaE [Spirochaetes bacterium]|jgi:tRNA threonylcarbamoyladenosine biosynthesis protein TsaE|nr:tRNA (adenosine(37)-N6)-threonylcarbamoyltransferase complex ATPase subunit type 1 TsaE [Spirochaetota bacterium]
MVVEYLSESELQTDRIAEEVSSNLAAGSVIAFIADLGCGKTLFTKFLAVHLGINEEITSPTFNLLEEYEGELPLYHFDLYRIESSAEFDMLGFEDYWEGDGISVIEWADRAFDRLPDNTIFIRIEYVNETTRRFQIEYPDN